MYFTGAVFVYKQLFRFVSEYPILILKGKVKRFGF